MSAAACVDWVVDEPHTLTRAWCTDLINFVNRNPLDGKVTNCKNISFIVLDLFFMPLPQSGGGHIVLPSVICPYVQRCFQGIGLKLSPW